MVTPTPNERFIFRLIHTHTFAVTAKSHRAQFLSGSGKLCVMEPFDVVPPKNRRKCKQHHNGNHRDPNDTGESLISLASLHHLHPLPVSIATNGSMSRSKEIKSKTKNRHPACLRCACWIRQENLLTPSLRCLPVLRQERVSTGPSTVGLIVVRVLLVEVLMVGLCIVERTCRQYRRHDRLREPPALVECPF